MIYNREAFNSRQNDLKERIDRLNKYYKKDVMDYLYSLVNLEETILKDPNFLDEFGSLDIIYDLMKFNITGRIYKVIDNDKNISQKEIISNNSIDIPNIRFIYGKEINFDIVNADYRRIKLFSSRKTQKPKLILKEVLDRTDENIDSIEYTIEQKNEYIQKLKEESIIIEKPKPSFFHKKELDRNIISTNQRIEIEEDEINRLLKRLATIKKYGHIESDTCNEICELIIKDLGIKEDEFTKGINKSLVKEYKNIDIIKRMR